MYLDNFHLNVDGVWCPLIIYRDDGKTTFDFVLGEDLGKMEITGLQISFPFIPEKIIREMGDGIGLASRLNIERTLYKTGLFNKIKVFPNKVGIKYVMPVEFILSFDTTPGSNGEVRTGILIIPNYSYS